jgi:hypothetical protein
LATSVARKKKKIRCYGGSQKLYVLTYGGEKEHEDALALGMPLLVARETP